MEMRGLVSDVVEICQRSPRSQSKTGAGIFGNPPFRKMELCIVRVYN